MRFITTIAIVLTFAAFSTATQAADVKIGVIDFQKILETSETGKAAISEFQEQGKKYESELKTKGEELEQAKKKLDADALVMAKEAREQKEQELGKRIGEYRSQQQKYMAEIREKEQKIVGQIQHDVFELVREIGKKDGYTMIVEKRVGGVIFESSSIDLTDTVLRLYDSQQGKSAAGSAGKKK
jgi:outer membrane protein